ncbi:HTH Tnp Tc5 domain containing protein [Pyrenophora teres f. teres]|uniref:HTH Tnp Tc5 domain containing protein n=1 Tax=Pyrenophora teres f. teres TaxID=97479 RepID=A0A6S6VU01_9PLEO|nr:HTH Tnp Tc5 domain containing protein [Pyrenophora teres f. teres]
MDPIEQAIKAIELRESGASFSYRAVAKMFRVDRTTLSRRHQGKTRPRVPAHEHEQLLNPQHEEELILYIERCTSRGLPPTREIMRNFAGAIAVREVSESWVTRFLHRHNAQLNTKWSAGIDRDKHKADS